MHTLTKKNIKLIKIRSYIYSKAQKSRIILSKQTNG